MSYLGCVGISKFLQSTKIDMSPRSLIRSGRLSLRPLQLRQPLRLGIRRQPQRKHPSRQHPLNEVQQLRPVRHEHQHWCLDEIHWLGRVLVDAVRQHLMAAWQGGREFWQDANGDFGNLIQCYVKQAPAYLNPRSDGSKPGCSTDLPHLAGLPLALQSATFPATTTTTKPPSPLSPIPASIFRPRFSLRSGALSPSTSRWLTVALTRWNAKSSLAFQPVTLPGQWSATNVLYEQIALPGWGES